MLLTFATRCKTYETRDRHGVVSMGATPVSFSNASAVAKICGRRPTVGSSEASVDVFSTTVQTDNLLNFIHFSVVCCCVFE